MSWLLENSWQGQVLWFWSIYQIVSMVLTLVVFLMFFFWDLVQKAKKAKDKLLKRDGEDRADTGSYESFYYGGVDPYMWEPQELGKTRLTFLY